MNWFWNSLSLFGGLALFLFGMNLMGQGLEKRAGNRLKDLLGRLTSGRFRGLLLGMAVTALIQSSSAVTVMAVGFVNSGLMTLHQVTGIIFGANIGTTVTAWLLSLTQIQGGGFLLNLLKPSSFAPIFATVGIVMQLSSKKESRRDLGGIFLGFAVLIFGMETMSAAVEPLSSLPAFQQALLWFRNPILGVLAGAILTAILQSSSAAIGVLQALSGAGQLTVGAAVPIIMGQNIGTCITAMLASVGAGRNAKRTAMIHLYFNVIGTVVLLSAFYALYAFLDFRFVKESIDAVGIASAHTFFNLLCTLLLFPFANRLEWLAIKSVPDTKEESNEGKLLDRRLTVSPGIAVANSRRVAEQMLEQSMTNVRTSFELLAQYDEKKGDALKKGEQAVDRMEDEIGNYLISIENRRMTEEDSVEVTMLLHLIVDFERISDHALNIAEAAAKLSSAKSFSYESGYAELSMLISAVDEIMTLSRRTFCERDLQLARRVEPLEQVVDGVKEQLLKQNISHLRENLLDAETGILIADILTDLERIADHCSNIAELYLTPAADVFRIHASTRGSHHRTDAEFDRFYREYREKFSLED